MVFGGVATLVFTLAVVLLLVRTDGAKAVSDNAAVIGAVIALGGVFTAQMVSIALDNRRPQHDALQTYLAKMSELLLDEKLHEKKANFDPARVTARLQTLAVLERLDAERKRTVLLFLREAQLNNRNVRLDPTDGRKVLFYAHCVGLRGADLSRANLSGARLTSASRKDPRLPEWRQPQRCQVEQSYTERRRLKRGRPERRRLEPCQPARGHGGHQPGVSATKPNLSKAPPCPTARSTRTGSKTKRAAERMARTAALPNGG
jgi:hypothetical protein